MSMLRLYLKRLVDAHIPVRGMVLFGSHARNAAGRDSDIDVIVLLDDNVHDDAIRDLWPQLDLISIGIDSRIETFPVTENRYATDDVSPLILAARADGVRI